jgi:DnaJ homolog subfamily B member 12
MESNKDEALRCLHISQRHRATGNLSSARKFVQKSLALFSTPEAAKLLEVIDSEVASSSSSTSSTGSSSFGFATTDHTSFTSATESHASASSLKQRHAPSSAESISPSKNTKEKREYTAENLAVVRRVRGCEVTEYYEILAVKRDCDEAEVKKAYRKVSHTVIRRCCVCPTSNLHAPYSWRSHYIQIKTVRQALTKPSRVCILLGLSSPF